MSLLKMQADSIKSLFFTATGEERCVSSVCGGNYLNATSCEIQSPGYPSSYESNMNCSWYIEASHPDQKISVEFDRLNLNEDNSRCQSNKISFYDSSTKSTSIFEPVCDLKHNRLIKKEIVSPGEFLSDLLILVWCGNE